MWYAARTRDVGHRCRARRGGARRRARAPGVSAGDFAAAPATEWNVMDPALKHWVGLWDYLDGNFWGVCQWAAANLSPEQVGWQPVPQVASVGWNLQHLGEM